MERQVQQRLVGAIVLVALGVIFIPMLFDQSDKQAWLSKTSQIPDEPNITVRDRLAEQEPIPEIVPPPALTETLPALQAELGVTAEDTVLATQNELQARLPAATATVAATIQKTPPKPVIKETKAAPRWWVQVGSFGKQANAQVLKDKLQQQQYKSAIAKLKGTTGIIYRVRVGPVTDRAKADNLLKQLQSKGYRGMVTNDE
ncbi:MAG: SPOR domain-containing protein [Gammaproteobacteria bacterium]|nr:SPOR domain-containing protein [Gammaproteobacteria bacterium]